MFSEDVTACPNFNVPPSRVLMESVSILTAHRLRPAGRPGPSRFRYSGEQEQHPGHFHSKPDRNHVGAFAFGMKPVNFLFKRGYGVQLHRGCN